MEKEKKKSTIEISHKKNIENFFGIIAACGEFGSKYNPANEDLTIAKMTARYDEAVILDKNYSVGAMELKVLINAQQTLFKELKSLCRRAYNSLKCSKENSGNKLSAKRKMEEITGDKVRRKKDEDGNVLEHTKSNSQLGMDDVLGKFYEFIVWLKNMTFYNPQEEILKVTGLLEFGEKVDEAKKSVVLKRSVVKDLMLKRDKGLYGDDTGLVDVSLACKSYVKSLYGARSEEAMTVTKILVKRLKRIKGVKEGA